MIDNDHNVFIVILRGRKRPMMSIPNLSPDGWRKRGLERLGRPFFFAQDKHFLTQIQTSS